MSVFSNVQNVMLIGATINNVAGNQTMATMANVAGTTSGSAVGNVPNMQAFESAVARGEHTSGISLPSGRTAPPRLTTMFTGREDILQQLIRYFDRSQPSMALKKQLIFVLYGLGGTGKTSIMMKFADEFSEWFSNVYYIDASTLATLQSCFEDIARSVAAGQTVDDALRWLSWECKEWLLLLDNADDPNINLRQFLPPCAHGNIIVTSRNKASRLLAPDSNCCVSGMEPTDAIELLFKYAMVERSDENRILCESIARELGYLALAVAQAGAYISQSSCLNVYLEIFREDRAELLQKHSAQMADDYKWTVYTTWEINVKKLTPATAMFLRICSFMHYEGISRTIFVDAESAEELSQKFQAGSSFLQNFKSGNGRWSEIRFRSCINELASYSLINVNAAGDTYSIHPLVHAWARDRASPAEAIDAQTCAMEILALSVLDDDNVEGYALRRGLIAHIDHARGSFMTSDLAAQLECIYAEAGRWRDAEELQHFVMEERQRELGGDHPDTLAIMSFLATTYSNQGHWDEAEKLKVQVVEARRKLFGDDHPDTLTTMANLASTYGEQGRWAEAEALKVKVMEARRRLFGEDHPDTLTIMANLACTYSSQGRWEEAESLEIRVIEARRRLLGDDHPDTLTIMANLAATYGDQSRWAEAETLEVQVVKSRRSLLGDDHPHTLGSMANLACTYRNQGRFKEAEELEVWVMNARRRLLGDDHRDTLTIMTNLASTYSEQGRWKEAEALEVRVMEARKKLLGDHHPDTLIIMDSLASIYGVQGRWDEAEALEVQVMGMKRRLLGDNHPDTLISMANLASTYHFQGRFEEQETLKAFIAEQRRLLGDNHADMLSGRGEAEALLDQKMQN